MKAAKVAVSHWLGTRKLGGKPNPSKCKIFYNDPSLEEGCRELADTFGFTLIGPEGGFVAAGTPLGSVDFVTNQLEALTERNEHMFSQLELMDPQCANLLLRQTTLPRMGYLMRTCGPSELGPHLAA